jgi:hypothetical protein
LLTPLTRHGRGLYVAHILLDRVQQHLCTHRDIIIISSSSRPLAK